MSEDQDAYRRPGQFVDADHPDIVAFARETAGEGDDKARSIALYQRIRDGIRYDPYLNYGDPRAYRASAVLESGRGFCVGKAALLAASARTVGVPARVGYADVRNHMTSAKLHALLGTDVFRWHSYAELQIEGRWVKATPAFDAALCDRAGLAPLPFDGETDSLFQPYDAAGRQRMEYLLDRGPYADVPFDVILADFRIHYPALMAAPLLEGDFRAEARGG